MRNVEKYFIYDFETTNLPTGVEILKDSDGNKILNEDGSPKVGYIGVLDNLVGIHQFSGYIVTIENKIPVVKEEFDFHIKPFEGASISDESLKIAGVTREQIENYTPEAEVFQQLVDMLLKYVNPFDTSDRFSLVGYNNSAFDDKLLFWLFQRNKARDSRGQVRSFGKGNFFYKGMTIDLKSIYSALAGPYRQFMDNFKLSSVCNLFLPKDDSTNYHDASYDVKVTKDLFVEFYKNVQDFRIAHKEIIKETISK